MKLSVIIVNYNVKYFLEQCLYSVLSATASLDAEIIVVDNASSDDSIEYLQPYFNDVIFIKSDQNLGFGKANNLALRSARGEFILFLNPDTLVPEDCLDKSIQFLDSRPSAGAVGIRMIDGSGIFLPESKRSFPTTAAAFYKLTGLSGLFPSSRRFNRYSLNYLDEHSDHSVEVLAGAFMMVRKQLLDKIGAFDEAFFMYGEDIDLSYRIRQSGAENWYLAQSTIIHFKGESTRKESLRYLKMFYEAMVVFVNKHYKGTGAWMTRSLLKAGIGLRGAVSRFGFSATPKPPKRYRNWMIIGSRQSYNECLAILDNITEPGRIIHHEQTVSSVNDLADLRTILQTNGITDLVFSGVDLSYHAIIRMMQTLGPAYAYRFHAKGSNSIVGSDSRDSTGETIASH